MVKVTPDLRPLSITMALAQISQNVEVTETRTEISIDPDSSLQATVLGKDFIDTLPDNEDELTEYLQQIAGSRGGAGANATFVIDGFTGGRIPPKDQIQEIRISNNPFSSEFSGISNDSRVVIYASKYPTVATRLYWTLEYLGIANNASLLDGGIDQWKKEHRPLSTDRYAVPKPGA